MTDTIRVRKAGLADLLRMADTGGFWSGALGIGYVAGPDGVMNVMVETDERGFPRVEHSPHCCSSRGCHKVCSHFCGTDLEAIPVCGCSEYCRSRQRHPDGGTRPPRPPAPPRDREYA